MKPHYLTLVLLIISLVFSASAAAFFHLNEHLLAGSHAEHHGSHFQTEHQQPADLDADHAHHFQLHVIGDLVEHDTISFCKNTYSYGDELYSRLISRTYTPPIPPPNA